MLHPHVMGGAAYFFAKVCLRLRHSDKQQRQGAAETFSMRTTIPWSRTILTLAMLLAVTAPALATPPIPSAADADYEASGFVTPAGRMPIGSPGVMPAMYAGHPPAMGGGVMPAGFLTQQRGCDCAGYGCNRCTGGPVGSGMMGGGPGGCPPTGGAPGGCFGGSCLTTGCFGGGYDAGCDGCGACCSTASPLQKVCGTITNTPPISCLIGPQGCLTSLGIGPGSLYQCLSNLRPFTEAGQCAPRWYDISAETVLLGRNGSAGSVGAISTLGIGGPTVLSLDDADLSGLEAGLRISGALVLGPGGNIEATYMGSNRWEGAATADSEGAPNLYSFISNFGTDPAGGFDDSDRSVRHGIRGQANFHSGEVNYRRRTVGPYCRYQGSWLLGLRYLRLDDTLLFTADGLVNNGGNLSTERFLDLGSQTSNDLFGVQAGGDLWWNMYPGINLGCTLKFGIMENDVNRSVFATGNSLGPGATQGTRAFDTGTSETTTFLEFNTALVYRISHSWAFRTSYYLLAVDEIAGGFDQDLANDLLDGATPTSPVFDYGSMVLNGVTFGSEYTW